MKDFIYTINTTGFLLRNGEEVWCPFAVDPDLKCGDWCALYDMFTGEHTFKDPRTGVMTKNPNLYIRLNCSHAVYTVIGGQNE